MRIALGLVLALFAASLDAQTTIVIGSWNIEHLGRPSKRGGVGNGVAQDSRDIADYIRASGVDILALAEVTANDGTDRNVTISAALQRIRQQTGQIWDHMLFPKFVGPLDERRHQRIGVAWNTSRVRRVSQVMRVNVPLTANIPGSNGSIWARPPHAVKFSFGNGKTDIVVIPLHMKANTDPEPIPVRKREAEARSLVAQLPAVRQAMRDSDIVLIGDTNFLRANEAAPQAFRTAGFRDFNAEDESTHLGGGPFDRVYVPANQPEFTNQDQLVFDTEFMQPRNLSRPAFQRRFSDHFMIVARVRVLAD